MFAILAAGVALWIIYGVLKDDWVIIVANTVSLALLLGILSFKLRERGTPARSQPAEVPGRRAG